MGCGVQENIKHVIWLAEYSDQVNRDAYIKRFYNLVMETGSYSVTGKVVVLT